MSRLNQVLAIEADAKKHVEEGLGAALSALQQPARLQGLSRTYQPKDEEGEQLPPESTQVQVKVDETLDAVSQKLVHLFDIAATKEYANTHAKADIMVDGQPLLKGVPATYLLFLEKQLATFEALLKRLPTLDPSEQWEHNAAQGTWATPVVETVRQKKIPRNHVKAEATVQHPAQVEVYHEDVPVGKWRVVKYSGALPVPRRDELVSRVHKLQQAVKTAREEANMVLAEEQHIGETLFKYLLA